MASALICHVTRGWATFMYWPNTSGERLHVPHRMAEKRLAPNEKEIWCKASVVPVTDTLEIGERIEKPEGWDAAEKKRGVTR